MFTLYKYELKKVVSQKYFLLASLIFCLFIVAVGLTPVVTKSIPSKQENQIVSNRYIDDELLDEARANEGKGIYSYITDFIKFCTNSTQIDDYSAKDVYDARLKSIDKEMGASYLTKQETAYWNKKKEEIKTPFKFYADTGYSEVYELVSMIGFITVILCNIAISGIFADEKQTGVDQILLSTKHGRSKLYTAKILVSLTLGIIIPIVLFLISVFFELLVFGSQGYNNPLQVHIPVCLYDITIGESMYYCLFKLVFGGIVSSTFAALLSEITKRHQAAQAISIVIMLLSMVSIPEKLRVLSYLWHFMPATNIGAWMFYEYRMINLFGIMLNDFIATPLVWIIASVIFIIIGKVVYKKDEVLGR